MLGKLILHTVLHGLEEKTMTKKGIVIQGCISMVVLLILGSLNQVVGYQTIPISKKTMITNENMRGCRQDDPVNWTVNGTMGNNGIYISPITLTCSFNQSIIAGVYYRYNDGGWVLYTEPFTISVQGMILFQFYAVDYEGNHGQTVLIHYGIDYTPPSLMVITHRIGVFTWRITAAVSDNLGIDYVEFYFDDVLQVTMENAPYEWTWTQTLFEKPVIKVVAYDVAGWNASYSKTSSTEYRPSQLRNMLFSVLMLYLQMRIRHVLY